MAAAAVALGATVIEKHFTLDRNLPGPDHRASLEPDELKAMVRTIRNIELALGDGIKRPTPSEASRTHRWRESLIVASRVIEIGEIFGPDNLDREAAGFAGVSPMRWDEVLGRSATRHYEPDDAIEL